MRNLLRMIMCLVLSIALAACVTTGGGGSVIESQSGTRSRLVAQTDDYRRTIVDAALIGAVVGGLGTAAITAAQGGDRGDVVRNGAIGAIIGAAIGGIVGTSVADTKRGYATREDSLRAAIRQASANNVKLTGMVSTANALVRQRRSEAAALKTASLAQKNALNASIGQDQSALSSAISASEREVSQLKALKARYAGNDGALDGQIAAAQAKQKELAAANKSLSDIRRTVQ